MWLNEQQSHAAAEIITGEVRYWAEKIDKYYLLRESEARSGCRTTYTVWSSREEMVGWGSFWGMVGAAFEVISANQADLSLETAKYTL